MKVGDMVCWHNNESDWGFITKEYKYDVVVFWILDSECSCVPRGAVKLMEIK